jgi:hypothetical protein
MHGTCIKINALCHFSGAFNAIVAPRFLKISGSLLHAMELADTIAGSVKSFVLFSLAKLRSSTKDTMWCLVTE